MIQNRFTKYIHKTNVRDLMSPIPCETKSLQNTYNFQVILYMKASDENDKFILKRNMFKQDLYVYEFALKTE